MTEPAFQNNLKAKVRSGAIWSTSGRLVLLFLQLASTIVLARFLTPDEYGLVAYVTIFVGFATLFTELGIGSALVHLRQPTRADLSTAFWINALSGASLTLLLCVAAPGISALLGQPDLRPLLTLGSLNFTLSLSVVHVALLERSLRIRPLIVVEVLAAVAGAATAIVLAVAGMGAVSLVWGTIGTTITLTVGYWTVVRWIPARTVSKKSWRAIWQYSKHLLGFNTINYWARNGDNLLVGRFIDVTTLGLYTRAYSLMTFPVLLIGSAIGRVTFPALASVQHDPSRLSYAYLRALRASVALGFPLSIGLACVAHPFIAVAYGPVWAPAAALLSILALSGPPQIMNGTIGSLLKAIGRTRLLFRLGTAGSALCLIAVAIALPYGGRGVVIAFAIQSYVNFLVALIPSMRAARVPVGRVFRTIAPICGVTGLMAIASLWAGSAMKATDHQLGILLVQVSVGVLTYAICLRIFAPAAWRDITNFSPRSR